MGPRIEPRTPDPEDSEYPEEPEELETQHRSMTAWRPSPNGRIARLGLATVIAVAVVALIASAPGLATGVVAGAPASSLSAACQLNSANGAIKHVIYIQFDNVHYTRDNPNVPSDLEQMPALLNFIKQNGVLATNQHTPLISHTSVDILTSLTGVYGNDMGVPVGNDFGYFEPGNAVGLSSSFTYWTDVVNPTTDPTYTMLSQNGQNAPAPWVPFTRAGCNFGAVATANLELESTSPDIATVFGAHSPQANEAQKNPTKATADFLGLAVHCAASSSFCSAGKGGVPDLLPDEPGGYSGYSALFGNKYIAPQISPGGPMRDLFGHVIRDYNGDLGFPGYDGMTAAVTLSYVAAMQEHGVPITYAYISDAHDNHTSGVAYGPGEAGYVATLASYNRAFADFFARLQTDGITPANTLFVITADEGDHFVGPAPSPADCNGVTVPCTYDHTTFGEIDTYLTGLLAKEDGISTPFGSHFDSAPTIYINGQPSATSPTTRALERAIGGLTATNPYTNKTELVTKDLADPTEEGILHMVTADPLRTPSFTLFGNDNYFFTSSPVSYCAPGVLTCFDGYYAWNHGDVQSQITTTWLGLVGPGVKHIGVNSSVWSDHADIRPTMLLLLGLQDDYTHEGYALVQYLEPWAIPTAIRGGAQSFVDVGQVYKEIDAPVGIFGLTTLQISTMALDSKSPGDHTYHELDRQLSRFAAERNQLASQMISLLEGAEFGGTAISSAQALALVSQANGLLQQVVTVADGGAVDNY
jgi:hypothetical protein